VPHLIAQGAEPHKRWRRALSSAVPIVLGRACGGWDVPWDGLISRRHAELVWHDQQLSVRRLPNTRNSIFCRGEPKDEFAIRVGEHFVIGGTTFTLVDDAIQLGVEAPPGATEQSFSPAYLHSLRFRDADERIEILSRLPEVIQGAASDEELFIRLIGLLLAGIPRATSAAVVALESQVTGDQKVRVMQWDCRSGESAAFCPSGRLIFHAVDSESSVVNVWPRSDRRNSNNFTHAENVDWAFCTPVLGSACRGWALYLDGQFPSDVVARGQIGPEELQDDLKFTELAASTLRSLREVRLLEQRQSGLRQFFSPIVLDALSGQDPDDVLVPREANVSVLFCDLRGFSRRSERDSNDLLGLLQRVSDALGVMTSRILEQGGVVGDFHGDSAMGFWGWPLEQPDAVQRAARAALAIRREFEQAGLRNEHPLVDFRIGIGLASGKAVAGKIGTADQVKVTVFGPVVNLAARLEAMTKILRAPILIDEETAKRIRQTMPSETARVRRVATVRPAGMTQTVEVSELLPPFDQFPQLSNEHIDAYEAALDALLAHDWETAFQWLHKVPAEDRVKDFLTVFIAQHNRTPPANWDGIIPIRPQSS
jgi:adenylate cyclase